MGEGASLARMACPLCRIQQVHEGNVGRRFMEGSEGPARRPDEQLLVVLRLAAQVLRPPGLEALGEVGIL